MCVIKRRRINDTDNARDTLPTAIDGEMKIDGDGRGEITDDLITRSLRPPTVFERFLSLPVITRNVNHAIRVRPV